MKTVTQLNAPSNATTALLDGLVDYAGLFPPSSENMRAALENYSAYFGSTDRRTLGRFIVPFARLTELEETAIDLLPRGAESEPWKLSVLVAEDVESAAQEMLRFNCRHWAGSPSGHAIIDVVELKASTADDIQHQRSALPHSFTAYFEIPHKGDTTALLTEIARNGSRAKIRTGGVTPDAFPAAADIIGFIAACNRKGVAFKATAGLHHPLRGDYALTYEAGSPTGTMYGFLNIFVAAALIHSGESEDTALAALEEREPGSFSFGTDAITWRGKRLDLREIKAARAELAISFGSCSFREPVDELESLTRTTHETT